MDIEALNKRLRRPVARSPASTQPDAAVWAYTRLRTPAGTISVCAPWQDPANVPGAAFGWFELGDCFEKLEAMPMDERMEWLRVVIAAKLEIRGAYVVSVGEIEIPENPPENVRGIERRAASKPGGPHRFRRTKSIPNNGMLFE